MGPVIVLGAGISGLCTAALLAQDGIPVEVYEKGPRVGGRTVSSKFRGHVLDNGFHIMPFYKSSAVYGVLARLGIADRLALAKVGNIAFYRDGFHRYPRGIADILRMSMLGPGDRIRLLRILLPMAFSSMAAAERADSVPLARVTEGMGGGLRSFFDAVCMLAFADEPESVSLGEFMRTIIRANPFRGGTSEFAYPAEGGYDRISELLASYVAERGGRVHLSRPIEKIDVAGGRVRGVRLGDGGFAAGSNVVVSHPAYLAVSRLFEPGVLDRGFLDRVARLNRTTSVVEVHFCTSKRIDSRQIVFPVGGYAAKGVFFISNIAPAVSPKGEHLLMTGTPVPAGHADRPEMIRETVDSMRSDLCRMYPGFEEHLLWERPMAWRLVESVAKAPGMVWKDKAPHEAPGISGLYFVGDSTVSYGIGTDSAAHSSVLCHPKIMRRLDSDGDGA